MSDPKPVESAEDVAQAIANAAYNLGLAPARELLEADRAAIRALRAELSRRGRRAPKAKARVESNSRHAFLRSIPPRAFPAKVAVRWWAV